jgi:TfoX/Sxy family transcriptional regulator of competence genes
MPYDEHLADRVRDLLLDHPDVTEKRMFGGLAFLVADHMAVAARSDGGLMVRVDPARMSEVLAAGDARPANMRGRDMRGWVVLNSDALQERQALAHWVALGVTRAESL